VLLISAEETYTPASIPCRRLDDVVLIESLAASHPLNESLVPPFFYLRLIAGISRSDLFAPFKEMLLNSSLVFCVSSQPGDVGRQCGVNMLHEYRVETNRFADSFSPSGDFRLRVELFSSSAEVCALELHLTCCVGHAEIAAGEEQRRVEQAGTYTKYVNDRLLQSEAFTATR